MKSLFAGMESLTTHEFHQILHHLYSGSSRASYTFDHPFSELIIWAVLTKRKEMAKLMWQHGEFETMLGARNQTIEILHQDTWTHTLWTILISTVTSWTVYDFLTWVT